MKSNSHERLVRLWAHQLERELLQHVETVGPYYTFDDLLKVLRSLPKPMLVNFIPEYQRYAFYEMIIRSVVQKSMDAELDAELFGRTDVSATARPPLNAKSDSELLERNDASATPRPPLYAEYVLYLVLRRRERDVVIGDLIESYGQILERFNKRRADFWFYKQVLGSLFPLLRRQILKIGALVWLGRILRRLIS